MKLLKEILHNQAIKRNGRTISREAVRAIIVENRMLLMVYSEKNGDYKFPGGGIEDGESHATALIREVEEEVGGQAIEIIKPFGKVIEYDLSIEKEYEVFKMTSYYYWCRVGGWCGAQTLDMYEKELGFTPVWVEIDAAIQTNTALLQDPHRYSPRWVSRELEVLQQVRAEL